MKDKYKEALEKIVKEYRFHSSPTEAVQGMLTIAKEALCEDFYKDKVYYFKVNEGKLHSTEGWDKLKEQVMKVRGRLMKRNDIPKGSRTVFKFGTVDDDFLYGVVRLKIAFYPPGPNIVNTASSAYRQSLLNLFDALVEGY